MTKAGITLVGLAPPLQKNLLINIRWNMPCKSLYDSNELTLFINLKWSGHEAYNRFLFEHNIGYDCC